jgi:hypothetical protein
MRYTFSGYTLALSSLKTRFCLRLVLCRQIEAEFILYIQHVASYRSLVVSIDAAEYRAHMQQRRFLPQSAFAYPTMFT